MKNKKIFSVLFLILLGCGILFFSTNVFANSDLVNLKGDIINQVDAGAGSAKLAKSDTRISIAFMIEIALSVTGSIFIALTVYGGYLYVTSGGEEEKAKKAGDIIKGAIIGLAIIFFAYSITNFVGSRATQVVNQDVEIQK